MTIYPKISENLEALKIVKPYIEKSKGMEIQILEWNENAKIINIVKELKERSPELENLTIHPPLTGDFNFEVLSYCNFENEIDRVKILIDLSKELHMDITLLYHTEWTYDSWMKSGAISRLKELIDLIKNTNINIVIENIHSLRERKNCAVLQIAKEINNEKLGVCIDICHLHIVANMFKMNFDEFLQSYLNREDCKRYVHQIHFAATLNNDGYIEKKTHGRRHKSLDDLKLDYKILKDYGMEDKVIVAEISEENYTTRVDQIEEIKMLESIKNT